MNHPSSKKECARSGAQAALQTGVYDLIMISVSTIVKLCQIDQSIIMWVPNERLFILRALCKQLAHAALPRLIPNAHDEMQIKRPLNCFHFNLFDFSSNNFQMPTKKKKTMNSVAFFSVIFFFIPQNETHWTTNACTQHFIQLDSNGQTQFAFQLWRIPCEMLAQIIVNCSYFMANAINFYG